jgi:hypothetical protein
VTEAARQWWNRWHVVLTWLLVEQVLPGAVLFALLLWLSHRYLRDGFSDIRHYAFAPGAARGSVVAPVRRNWFSCTCVVGACRCASAIVRGLRRCCASVLQPSTLWSGLRSHAAAIAL